MARGRRRRREANRAGAISLIRSLTVPLPRPPIIRFSPLPSSAMRQVEDRREFHPSGRARSARLVDGRSAAIQVGRPSRSRPQALPAGVRFSMPWRVMMCVRRKRRREVMFAKGKAGRRGQRPPRRNYYSEVSC